MPSTGVTRAAENKRIRQEALREQLAKQKHVEKVIESINKLEDLNTEIDTQRIKAAIDSRLKLISKYLPDLKQSEIDHTLEGSLTHNLIQVEYVSSDESTDS